MARAGCAIVGQTAQLAPADRRLYAIRDATGTVESIPLIVASILSKKLAAGLERAGDGRQGRLRRVPAHARAGATSWPGRSSRSRRATGCPPSALLTDMDRVLGRTAGNAVEVRESIDHLTGAASDARLREVTLALSAELLRLGGIEATRARPGPRPSAPSTAARRRSASRAWSPSWAARPDLLEAPDRHLPPRPSRSRRSRRKRGRGRGRRARGRPRDHRPRRRPRARDRPDRPRRRADGGRGARRAGRPGRAAAGAGACGQRRAAPTGPSQALRAAYTVGDPPRGAAGRCSRCCGDPQGRAARAPRGHGAARPDPPPRASATACRSRRACSTTTERFAYTDFLDFLRDLRPRRERHPHRRGLPRRHLRVPGRLRPARARSTSS